MAYGAREREKWKANLLKISDLRAAAKRFGATVQSRGSSRVYVYGIEAPRGMVWSCAKIHEIVIEWYKGSLDWKHAPIADALARMEEGLHPCEEEDCEWCQRD